MEKHRIIDMHVHSNASDGSMSPEDVVNHALDLGIETMSLTDHDTLIGNKELSDDCKSKLEFITGIELSAKVSKGRMHILGYDIDLNSPVINSRMDELRDNSVESVKSYFKQLRIDYGISFSENEISEVLNSTKNIGRPDIAALCVKYGYAVSVRDAFNKYLIDIYDKTREDNKGITAEDCIKLIKSANGIAVIAHPHSLELNDNELLSALIELKSYGLEGIEVYHSHHNLNQRQLYLELASKLSLLVSGGSDFHGYEVKPEIELGAGEDNIDIIKLTLLDRIRSRK